MVRLSTTKLQIALASDDLLASGSDDKTVAILSIKKNLPVQRFCDHRNSISCLCWNPNIPVLATSSWDKTICIRDLGELHKNQT